MTGRQIRVLPIKRPNSSGPVPRAAFLAEQAGRRDAARGKRAAEQLAARRDEILMMALGCLALALREQVIGAGYRDLGSMSDTDYGAYRERVRMLLLGSQRE